MVQKYFIAAWLLISSSVWIYIVSDYWYLYTVRVEIFEVFLISRFSWVAHHTKIIHVEGGINTREIF